MGNDILTKRVDRRVCSQHALHLPKHLLALLDCLHVGLRLQKIIGRVDQRKGILIQFQMNHTTFIIDRTGSSILDSLGHIIDIDIVAENLPGVPILGGNGCPCKANERSIGECIADDARITNNDTSFFFTFVVLANNNAFVKAILPAVCLVRHDNDISTFRQRFLPMPKFEHRRKDDPVRRTTVQERL